MKKSIKIHKERMYLYAEICLENNSSKGVISSENKIHLLKFFDNWPM